MAREIEGGRFMVAGGEPGMKVSWQVAGVRQDALALATPLMVEVEKLPHETGKYVNPEAFGMPRTSAVGYHEERAVAGFDGRAPRPMIDRNEGE